MNNRIEYKKIERRILIVFVFAVTTVIGTVLYLNQSTGDFILSNNQLAPIINKSGRQRMLSQNISKNAYSYLLTPQNYSFSKLELLVSEFSTAHSYLKNWNENNSKNEEISRLFKEIEPHYNDLINIKSFLEENSGNKSTEYISSAESNFLPLMNQITFEFEESSINITDEIRKNAFKSNYMIGFAVLISASGVLFITLRIFKNYSRQLSKASQELDDALQGQQRKLKKLQFLTNTLSVGVWENDKLEGIESWSPKMYSILGLKNNEVEGTSANFIKRVHPSDRDKLMEASKISIAKGVKSTVDLRVLTTDKSYKWIEASGNAKLNEEGQPEVLIGGVMDITDRKLLEMQLNDFFEFSPSIVAMFDNELNYLVASSKWCDFLGLNKDTIKGINVLKAESSKHQDYSESDAKTWQNIHERGLKGEAVEIKNEKITLDGQTFIIDWDVRPWYVSQDEIGGIIIQITNNS